MSKFFNIYENIDNIDPAELKRAAGLDNPEEVTWPKGKTYKVMLEGKECSVVASFSGVGKRLDGNLDAYTALSTMMTRDEVVDRLWKEDPNGGTDAVYYAHAEFLPGLPQLTDEELNHRIAFTAAVLTLLSDQKTMELIAECAPRKKNGLFHNGRYFKIGLTGLAWSYDSELVEIVGHSKDETKLSITIKSRNTSPDEIDQWNQDFISTYHEGLPISEAFKAVFEKIDSSSDSTAGKAKTIVPDLYKGLGDGTQEIDTSALGITDYAEGIPPRFENQARAELEIIRTLLVDPNEIEWDGKGVYIDRLCNGIFLTKLREMGALPLRTYNNKMNYMIRSIDYLSYFEKYPYSDGELYISHLKYMIDEAASSDGIIEEKAFLRWCVNGHSIKYDLSKDEHLKQFENDKISFKKIDHAGFIKQAIKKTDPERNKDYKDIDNKEIYYCVVGTGDKQESIREFFKSIGKTVKDCYVEGARWPRLIMDDTDGPEERRAFKVLQYNKACGEKVQLWKVEEVLKLIDRYGEDIKEYAEEDYDNATLDQLVKQIIEAAETGSAVDANQAEAVARAKEDNEADAVRQSIKRVDNIDFEGTVFAFYGRGTVNEIKFAEFDDSNSVYKTVREKGGIVRENVNGKTDYYVILETDETTWLSYKTRDAAKQLEKRDTLNVITLGNLVEILNK